MKRQLDKIVLEITQFEVINGCFQATCKDLQGETIQATFHSDCKDQIKEKKCRKGSIVVLKDVSAYCVADHWNLVMMGVCIDEII